MRFLFFDTETTGLPLFNEPSDDPRQPHIVQLALLLTDAAGTEQATVNVIVRPHDWTIPDDVAAIHGITQERALNFGIPETAAVQLYLRFLKMGELTVAHNLGFDQRIMRIALMRCGMTREEAHDLEKRPGYCTARGMTKTVNAAPTERMLAAGRTHAKTPKLAECIKFLFGEELLDAHDALADVRACKRVFFEAQRRGIATW